MQIPIQTAGVCMVVSQNWGGGGGSSGKMANIRGSTIIPYSHPYRGESTQRVLMSSPFINEKENPQQG